MTSTHSQTQGPAIEVSGLRKAYGELEAVRGVSFEVARGEVFCLLGPNGAGKTTTVEILEGYRVRSAGDVRVLGYDPAAGERELREAVGIVLQQCGVQRDLTVRELVEMYGRYHERSRPVDEVIALVELTEKRDVRAKDLSGGQRRRLDLALALVGDPELIFLDEPTTGFDPAARRQAWSTIKSLCELGKTVFLTTHFMDEAQALADRVAVMRGGEIIASGGAAPTSSADATCARPRSASRFRPTGRWETFPTCRRWGGRSKPTAWPCSRGSRCSRPTRSRPGRCTTMSSSLTSR
ncbi:MAG: ABC transporter ATP-binding protein [Solirubrobacteraceae bacterium]